MIEELMETLSKMMDQYEAGYISVTFDSDNEEGKMFSVSIVKRDDEEE